MLCTRLLKNTNLVFLLIKKKSKHNISYAFIYKITFKNRHLKKLIGLKDDRIWERSFVVSCRVYSVSWKVNWIFIAIPQALPVLEIRMPCDFALPVCICQVYITLSHWYSASPSDLHWPVKCRWKWQYTRFRGKALKGIGYFLWLSWFVRSSWQGHGPAIRCSFNMGSGMRHARRDPRHTAKPATLQFEVIPADPRPITQKNNYLLQAT